MIKELKLIKNIFARKTPRYVVFFVTSKCNVRCKMCFNWKNVINANESENLTINEIKKIYSEFSDIQQLTISGGEPFLRSDLPKILEFISHNNDVQSISLPTNGTLTNLIVSKTEDILKKIKKETHLRIGLSVLGINEIHDKVVMTKGAFNKLKNTYYKLIELESKFNNLNIDINICCSYYNKKYMKETIDYCREIFNKSSITITLARGNLQEKIAKEISPEEYEEIINYLYKNKNNKKMNKPFSKTLAVIEKISNEQVINIMKTNKMPSRCYCYSNMIVIQNNGDVFPCEYLDNKLGNLKNNSVSEILNLKENKKIEKSIIDKKCCCTWECALMNNIVSNPKKYFNVLKEYITY